jgi:hypothetical protein
MNHLPTAHNPLPRLLGADDGAAAGAADKVEFSLPHAFATLILLLIALLFQGMLDRCEREAEPWGS